LYGTDPEKSMKSFIVTIFFILVSFFAGAQERLLDSMELAMHPEYTSLEEALKDPDAVLKLSLRKQKLKKFPKEVLRLKNLQYLDLSRNKIKELDDSIVYLANLQYLIVSRTGLERLPVKIGLMKNLKHLNVNQNEIQMLPFSFGDLENLEVADLWSNNLDYFPESMSKMKNLRWMDLRNILIPQVHQDNIQGMLPDTFIHFSPPCQCSW
jgi:Leucine-rich repeat (LRR) protein